MHEARHLVARAAQTALGALERERGLARDELGEAGGLADRAAHRLPPALAQLARGRGLARHDPAAVELAPRDPALAQRVRIARIAAHQIDEARAALAVALARKPRDAQRREQRIAVAGELRLELRDRHAAAAAARRGDVERVPSLCGRAFRAVARDPRQQHPALEPARGVEQK